jgi:hypothetical protein
MHDLDLDVHVVDLVLQDGLDRGKRSFPRGRC